MKFIKILGKEYRPIKSTEEICSGGASILKAFLSLDVFDEDKVMLILKGTTSRIDSWFGKNVVSDIADGEPVSAQMLLKIVNEVMIQLSEIYKSYVTEEYSDA